MTIQAVDLDTHGFPYGILNPQSRHLYPHTRPLNLPCSPLNRLLIQTYHENSRRLLHSLLGDNLIIIVEYYELRPEELKKSRYDRLPIYELDILRSGTSVCWCSILLIRDSFRMISRIF